MTKPSSLLDTGLNASKNYKQAHPDSGPPSTGCEAVGAQVSAVCSKHNVEDDLALRLGSQLPPFSLETRPADPPDKI